MQDSSQFQFDPDPIQRDLTHYIEPSTAVMPMRLQSEFRIYLYSAIYVVKDTFILLEVLNSYPTISCLISESTPLTIVPCCVNTQ